MNGKDIVNKACMKREPGLLVSSVMATGPNDGNSFIPYFTQWSWWILLRHLVHVIRRELELMTDGRRDSGVLEL